MSGIRDLLGEAISHPMLVLGSILVLLLTYPLTTALYNLFLHPLHRFPGPLLYAASPYPWAIRHALGTSAFHTERLHARYGPVVRIGPNHLSFTSPAAWRDAYNALPPRPGNKAHGHWSWPEMPKSKTFTSATDDQETSILQAEYYEHGRLRRALAPGFADAALKRWTGPGGTLKVHVDLLVEKLKGKCRGDEGSQGGEGTVLDMEKWYGWTMFDIGGELVWGRTFGCLDKEEYHPWVDFLMGTLKAAAAMVSIIYLGGRGLVRILFNTVGQKSIETLRKMTEEILTYRLGMEEGRVDLFEGLLKHRDEWNLSFEKLSTSGLVMTMGGSETLASSLSGTTYLLLENPSTWKKLAEEVRTAFTNADDITVKATAQLPYLTAVINEGFRMYPPVVADLVRVVPPEGKEIAGHFIAGGALVEVQPWSANHSADNWVDPWTFNPDRFLVSEEEARAAGNIFEASQIFSYGPRNCLGRNLAYAEMRLILARLVFEFDMELQDDSHDWIMQQKTYPLWDRLPLNVHIKPVMRN
ncbi:cytochrome P450 [Dichotomopilus funicola]|uniref:Cytochrome P450 n=1 Tax=Dichotomopilus funicola TaxID=1934379 RepID=A0AAN6ZPD7_9PEZI|nr:cytochrome P450 [Dichotomopilus funicola]